MGAKSTKFVQRIGTKINLENIDQDHHAELHFNLNNWLKNVLLNQINKK